jgi:hypothetical protein
MILVFTICSNNYLAQAISLGASLLKHNPGYIFKICLVDRKNELIQYDQIPYELVEVEKIGISSFDDMFRRYNITEFNTAVKPFYFQYFFNKLLTITNIIYLDPDILVYSPFTELDKVLEENEIVITPHFTTPINDDKFQAENDFLNSGLYNLGFLALKRSIESDSFLEWWAARLTKKAYINFAKGMFTDQLWINFAPLFFEKVHIFRHPGYNMAYWNLHERVLNNSDSTYIVNKKFPLVFFHFSGYDPLIPQILSKYQNRFSLNQRTDIQSLFENYSYVLIRNNFKSFSRIQCYFEKTKQEDDKQTLKNNIRKIPLLKRAIRKIILKIISILNIEMDYSKMA